MAQVRRGLKKIIDTVSEILLVKYSMHTFYRNNLSCNRVGLTPAGRLRYRQHLALFQDVRKGMTLQPAFLCRV